MKLFLSGEVKYVLPLETQGIYHLQDKLVNNYPHWHQINGSNSIWFGKEYSYSSFQESWKEQVKSQRRWFLGPRKLLGGKHGYIIGPKGISNPPTRILQGWMYIKNDEWREAIDSEIIFQDLSPSKSSKLKM